MNTSTRAATRIWNTSTDDLMDGAVVQVRTHTVTLTRTPTGIVALIDGQPADVLAADAILRSATTLTVTAEVLEVVIGKPAACELHKELGRLRFRDHYATASDALGRRVTSLAALTADEAATVRSYAYGQWGLTG